MNIFLYTPACELAEMKAEMARKDEEHRKQIMELRRRLPRVVDE